MRPRLGGLGLKPIWYLVLISDYKNSKYGPDLLNSLCPRIRKVTFRSLEQGIFAILPFFWWPRSVIQWVPIGSIVLTNWNWYSKQEFRVGNWLDTFPMEKTLCKNRLFSVFNRDFLRFLRFLSARYRRSSGSPYIIWYILTNSNTISKITCFGHGWMSSPWKKT